MRAGASQSRLLYLFHLAFRRGTVRLPEAAGSDIYFQAGLVTLVGLTAENAILIVEFAMEKLRQGMPLMDATIEAARLRFRPIVMTSLAFIVGTLPLALSSSAVSNSRHVIGTTVVGEMVSATVIGVLFIPIFFYLVVRIKQRFSKNLS